MAGDMEEEKSHNADDHVWEPCELPVIDRSNVTMQGEHGCVKPSKLKKIYERVHRFTLSYETLIQNAYPLDTPEEPEMVVLTEYFNSNPDGCETWICNRCGAPFKLLKGGQPLAGRPCRFHTGLRVVGKGTYSCCGSTEGCQLRPFHFNFMCNFPKVKFSKTGNVATNSHSIYALDTEMCLTERGFEVTEVTVVDTDGHIVFHSLLKPEAPIVDYVTLYSGITEGDLEGVSTTLEDVQAVLLSLFDTKTIIIGHGLQNDLRALRIIHTTVIDTSVIFPDARGHPYKRSLKSLVSQYLRSEIQPMGKGHNSVEDAWACMKLVKWYVKHHRSLETSCDIFYSCPQASAVGPYAEHVRSEAGNKTNIEKACLRNFFPFQIMDSISFWSYPLRSHRILTQPAKVGVCPCGRIIVPVSVPLVFMHNPVCHFCLPFVRRRQM